MLLSTHLPCYMYSHCPFTLLPFYPVPHAHSPWLTLPLPTSHTLPHARLPLPPTSGLMGQTINCIYLGSDGIFASFHATCTNTLLPLLAAHCTPSLPHYILFATPLARIRYVRITRICSTICDCHICAISVICCCCPHFAAGLLLHTFVSDDSVMFSSYYFQ